MSPQASVKRAIVVSEQQPPDDSYEDDRKGLRRRLRMWKEILVAELLNLLERGRYNLKLLS